jgi:hypothetical protein
MLLGIVQKKEGCNIKFKISKNNCLIINENNVIKFYYIRIDPSYKKSGVSYHKCGISYQSGKKNKIFQCYI